MNNAEPLNIIT